MINPIAMNVSNNNGGIIKHDAKIKLSHPRLILRMVRYAVLLLICFVDHWMLVIYHHRNLLDVALQAVTWFKHFLPPEFQPSQFFFGSFNTTMSS